MEALQEDLEFLEHYGVKGMKWGVRRAEARAAKGPNRLGNRNNRQVQRRINRLSRVASGKASKGDIAKTLLLNTSLAQLVAYGGLKGATAHKLDRAQRIQQKTQMGKKNVSDILRRIGGVDIRELDLSYDVDAATG